jgi:D-xylose 1-dehydrogenase (NADP+, D-xylono-1,5-lactone-forming)
VSLRLGLLSTAHINRMVVAGARASELVDVVAVASRDRGRAEAYAQEHGIERAHGSYEELLGDPDVDAVYVSLPNAFHVEWSIRALEAGKHVLCEKPLSHSPAEVERAFAAAERAGRVLVEAFMYRHHPQTAQIAGLVAEGAIGRVRLIRSSFTFPLADVENIRLRPELEGGALMDVGCYCVNGSRLLAGEPERVRGEAVVGETGVDIGFYGTMRHASGVVAQFDASFELPHRQRLEVFGDAGSLLVEAPWRVDWGGRVLLRRGDASEEVAVEEADAYRLELDDLAQAAAGARKPLLGREDTIGQARAIGALHRSAAEGRAVEP